MYLLVHRRLVLLGTAILVFFVCEARSDDQVVAFENAKIIPVEGKPIERGTLVIAEGKILAIGPVDEVEIPAGAERRDVAGRVVMPGLICTHSHIGGSFAADGSHPVQPGVRVLDAVNVRDSGLARSKLVKMATSRSSTVILSNTPATASEPSSMVSSSAKRFARSAGCSSRSRDLTM